MLGTLNLAPLEPGPFSTFPHPNAKLRVLIPGRSLAAATPPFGEGARRLRTSAGVVSTPRGSWQVLEIVEIGVEIGVWPWWGSGFVRRSQTFEGAVTEGTTLARMLPGLGAPRGALVVMDAGIATAENLLWLRTQGYRYLVVSRERQR